jgi:hypothetical protein
MRKYYCMHQFNFGENVTRKYEKEMSSLMKLILTG